MPRDSPTAMTTHEEVRPPGQQSILWIDDDRGGTEVNVRLLTLDGFDVVTAESGTTGLMLAKVGAFDLVLLDLELPDMSGLDVLRSLNQLGTRAPVVLVTGFATVSVAVRAVQAGAVDVVEKPVMGDELCSLARRHAVGRPARSSRLCRSDSPAYTSLCRQLIEVFLSRPSLSLDQVARQVGIERHRLEKLVREETGVSFRQWRLRIVMKQAGQILGSSDVPVKTVAFQLGYRSTGAFSRAFEAVVGVTPIQYRRQFEPPTEKSSS